MDKNDFLKKVIGELAGDTELTDDKLSEYLNRFNIIYSDDFRHDYSEITRILFLLTNDQDARDFMASKIKDIYNKSKEYDQEQGLSESSKTTKALRKLKDHINLENIRMAEFLKISGEVNNANEVAATLVQEIDENQSVMNKLNSEVKKAENNMKNIQEQMKESTTESITILSIFAGIVMAFSGGMSFISNAISGINKIGPYRLSIFILLIGDIMFNVIFLLLYMVGKIINKYTGSASICHNPKEFCEKKNFSCYAIKYPYVVWFNFWAITGIVVSLYLSFIDRFNIFTRTLNGQCSWGIWSVIIGIMIAFIFWKVGKKIKKSKCLNQ